ncbi:general amino acid permease AGP3 [Meredithblackwellia eburnea MCA 4105]
MSEPMHPLDKPESGKEQPSVDELCRPSPPGSQMNQEEALKRHLKSRHMQMLAIGGVIGPGYFVGMGSALSNGGGAGCLLGFTIIGMMLWCTMQSLGEMAAFLSVSGSFTNYMSRFLDPALGFSLGWNYCILWFGILAAEYQNAGLVLTYWHSAMPSYGFIIIFWFLFLGFGMLGVRAFGEFEFYLTAAKILFILAFFLCSILISSGAIGNQGPIGFKYYQDPGAFNGVAGLFKVFVFAALQYSGTEMIGITAGESARPDRDVPKAVRFVFWRVLIIFVFGIFFLNLVVPWNDPSLLHGASKTARSPFVIAFVRAGLGPGADVVNCIVILTVFSALNGALYVTSRCVAGLAADGMAPKFLGWINRFGVPWTALIFANLFGFICLLNRIAGAAVVYSWIVNISGVATFIRGCISLAHIRFRKALSAQGISLDELPFKAAFFPYTAYISLIGNIIFIFFQGWTAFLSPFSINDFFMNYIMIPVFIIMYLGFKLVKKTKWVKPEEADLVTGRRNWNKDALPDDIVAPKVSWPRKVFATVIG